MRIQAGCVMRKDAAPNRGCRLDLLLSIDDLLNQKLLELLVRKPQKALQDLL